MTECVWRFCFSVLLITGLLLSDNLFSQDFLPKLDQIKSLQRDSNNFYFKEIWIKSKDINFNDPEGFIRRASDKLNLGYFEEALPDVNKSIGLDSTNGRSYSLKGYIMLKYDSLNSALKNFGKAIYFSDTSIYNYYYSAEVCMIMGKFREADSLYNITINQDKNFLEGNFGLANLYFLKGDLKQSEVHYKKVININPDFAGAYFNLAIIYSITDLNKAIRYLDKSIEVNQSFAHAYYFRGYLKQYQNKIPATLKDWNKAIELDPENNLYRVSRAFLNIYANKFHEGFDELSLTIETSNTQNFVSDFEQSPKTQLVNDFISQIASHGKYAQQISLREKGTLVEAMCLFFLGKHNRAEEIYKNLSMTTAFPGLIYYLRGFNLEYLKKPELSLNSYNSAVKERSFPNEVFLRQGIVYYDLKRYQNAIQSLNIYINNNDSTKVAYRIRAHSYCRILEFDSALIDYNNFLKIDSTELDIYFDRAFCFKELERYQDAITDYSYIIKHKEMDLESLGLLAECKYLSRDTIGAFNLLNETHGKFGFLEQDGYFLRGMINLSFKNYDSAIADFDQIIKHNVHHTEAYTLRGLAYYNKVEYVKARNDLTSALKIDDTDIVALYTRGMVYIKMNKLSEAFADLQKADSLGHPLAKKALQMYLNDFAPNNKI
jgi:tetratricopeptide (TPR) repeat protein